MGSEPRKRFNFVNGILKQSFDINSATLRSDGLQDMPAVSPPDIALCGLDPESRYGPPEILYITYHAVGSDEATVVRAREGTIKRNHPINTPWVHSLFVSDIEDINHIHIQNAAPVDSEKYIWIETGLGLMGDDFTFWFKGD